MNAKQDSGKPGLRQKALAGLAGRNLILVGLMGAGKTAIGKLVANTLNLPYIDTDQEIETAARMTVSELFTRYGEPEFRALETRVFERILAEGPAVVSTGGGAFINPVNRELIARSGLSMWLKADLETLWDRVKRRQTRPLLKTENPKQTLKELMDKRYPVYAEAELTVWSRNVRKETVMRDVLKALAGLAENEGTNSDA
ncbi:shikimate kinase [Martelella endophytica]|uniref:Shikimate kinase n=1 Tax=Martelella endophytica TaxID=1486262 RepID=A0A0D5LR26_MAREN|nr:shikimate kinase [Martelella endophytica]AJY46222.1 shikimate kinase [Martelella endophytica]